jgi:uncharacterized protein (TIGR02145 family)
MRIIQFSSIVILLLSLVVSCQKELPEEIVLEYSTLTDIDGNTYKTVKIGDSWWMCENLKVSRFNDGTPLNAVAFNDTATWQGNASFKFFNDSLYGKLYNYLAVSDSKGLAPEGWHVASDAEWKALERAIGMDSAEVELFAWRGNDEANLILSEGSNNWPTNSAHFGSNAFGLAIQPGGIVQFQGIPTSNSLEAYFWTSTLKNSEAIYRSISHQRTQIFRQSADMRYGMSVRCVKN